MTSSNTAGAGAAPSSASTLGLLPFTVAYLDAICSSPSASDSIAASAQPEGQTLPAPQRMPPSLGLSRTEGYILNHLTMPRSISYTDRSLSEDAASHQHLFPLKRPPNVQVVRRALTVPDVIFNMNPSALIAYTVPHSPNASNVWPDKRPDNSPTAAYIAYPLPRKMLDMEEPTSSLVDFIWTDCREQPHLNAPPMYPTTTAATADAAKGPAYDRLPQEMWNAILKHLSHDDLKALRLTCRRLNQSTTKALFDTVVVPFRPGMFSEELRAELENHSGKGKGRSTAINIFKSHGHHIKKFGLSYEVTEARLAHLPKLVQHDLLESYWGTYYWPSSPVHQPDDMPASVMEEIVGMKDAFSDMPSLKELALSIDNGLGWLPGPDKSIRSQIIQDRIQLFPNRNGLPTRSRQAQQELWDFVKSQYKDQDKSFELSQAHLFRVERMGGRCDLPGPYTGIPRDLQHIDRRILLEATTPEGHPTDISSNDGFLVVAPDNWTRSCTSHPVQPSNLTEEQLEMLLKTQWAQDSLIDSYIIGVIDSETCRRVTALNLACLPARCVPFFDRADFWDALPCLESLKLMIMGEIREMDKDFFGNASSISAMPLKGIQAFRTLLVNHIAERSNIKNLTIGWVGGGEHASGMLGRNRHILPAPFMDVRTAASPYMMDDVNIFPHIEHLTLNNCWMTPRALDCLVDGHRQSKLRKLTLDSVSLQLLPVGAGGQMPTAGFRIPNPIPGRPDMVFPQREGSWPYVLDGISPGAHFGHFNGGTRNHRSKSSLKEIELISCGYSVLEATNAWSIESMDREFLDANNAAAIPDANAFPNSRRAVLESVMAKVRDVHLGTIVQHIPQVEADILEAMWGATLGWSDLDSRHAVALDGLRDGGTGRFSAVIRAPDLG